MNQNIKPLTALLILLFFGGLLWGKFAAHNAAVSVLTFSHLHKHPNGTAYIMLDNQLFGFNDQALLTSHIDLANFGINSGTALTDFAFFANGDLLIRRHVKDNGLVYNLQRYLRLKNMQDEHSTDANNGLFRCDPGNFHCLAFTKPPLNLNDAYSLAIDWQTDQVFIADTSRHIVRLFSGTGEEQDTKEGFFFPNQVYFQDNKLYVADTNHHQLSVIGVNGNRFGNVKTFMPANTADGIAKGDVWPSGFLLTEGQCWIRNANDNMEFGGIYVFKDNGIFIKQLTLPAKADPFALLRLGDKVLVSDFNLDAIHQFDLDGKALADFQHPIFNGLLAKLSGQKTDYQNIDLAFTIAFALCLIGGFGYALYQESKQRPETIIAETPQDLPPPTLDGLDIYWLKPRFSYIALLSSLPILLIAWLAFIKYLINMPLMDFIGKTYPVFFAFIVLVVFSIRQLSQKIGISDQFFIVASSLGKPALCAKTHILYSGKFIAIGICILNLKQLSYQFSEDELGQWLYPAVKQGRQVDLSVITSLALRKKSVWLTVLVSSVFLAGFFVYLGIKNG
jgi:hypothetical protein